MLSAELDCAQFQCCLPPVVCMRIINAFLWTNLGQAGIRHSLGRKLSLAGVCLMGTWDNGSGTKRLQILFFLVVPCMVDSC